LAVVKKADLIIHPIRIRILTEFAGRHITARQLSAALPDIPQATLYRHLKLLEQAGVIQVVAETQVNGATERTFAVNIASARLSPEDLRAISREQHLQYFTVYAMALIDSFAAYIKAVDLNAMGTDGLEYQRSVIYLSDEEVAHYKQAMGAFVQQLLAHEPSPERKRYTIASIVIPGSTPDERNNS
jgi:DNA-binding transcriptional ArsR family regulator